MERKGRDYRHGGGKAVTWRKRTPRCTQRKNVAASAPRGGFVDGARFEFQKRIARIDWRTLHTIDIDRVIHEVDIDTLESVLDTVAFGDIQGEDTRHFTEANFVKIFRLAQLMVEYLLHVQDLLEDHKSGLLQSRANMEQKNEKIRSRFLCQRDALIQSRHELKQDKKTLKTYEVMLKVQEENNQTSQSKEPQDMHVARKHQNKQEVTQDNILALVSTAEEASAARVKAEMSSAVQTEIQQLRERHQADLQRAETNSNTQVQTMHEDLRQSNNQLREVQTRVEVLQAQFLSNSPDNSRLGSLQAVEKSKEKCHGPNQERLYELESKFSALERQVKTLGQAILIIRENSRLLKELNVAYTEVSDLQMTKRQSAFALETQIDDLLKENQHLRRTMSKVNHMAVQAGFISDTPDKMKAYCQSTENPSVNSSPVCTSRTHSPPRSPQIESVEVPSKLLGIIHGDEANAKSIVHPYHETPESIHAIIEAKEPGAKKCAVSDSRNLDNTTDLGLVQPSNTLNNCFADDGFSPVHQSPFKGRPEVSIPLKKLNFSGGVMLTNMIEEEPVALSIHKDRRVSSTRERWTDKDEALRALARPTTGRRRREAVPEEPSEGESSPDPENLTHTTSPVKRALRFLTPERTRIPFTERPKNSAAPKQITLRGGGDSPTTVEEMRAKLEWEMAAAHEEQKKRQKAVQQLLAKELVKEKRKTGKRTRSEDTKNCKAATQYSYTFKSDTPSDSIAPLLLALPNKLETISTSSTIHTVRKIVSNRAESERFQPILTPLPETRIQPFHSPTPYKPGPCCKRPLHPYLRRGIGNPQTRPHPQPSFHMAVLSSNPDLKSVTRNRIPNQTVAPSKEHLIARLSAVTRELGKYFSAEKPKLKCGTSSGSAQPTIPDIETTETDTNETEVSDYPSPFTIVFEASMTSFPNLVWSINTLESRSSSDFVMVDEVEKRTTPPENGDIPRLQEISEVADTDIGEVAHTIRETEAETETETETQEETANDLSGKLSKQLKKFGIASFTNGISDTTYKSISSALEMQRSVRMSQIHGDERQIVDYERDAVVWHTQMAVRDRDLVIVKSPFNVVTDSGSDHSNASEYSVEESGRSKKSNEPGCESREDSREGEMKTGGASDVRSSEQCSPLSSESSDDIQETEVTYKSKNLNCAKNSKVDGSVHLSPRSPPPEGRVQYVSRTYSWDSTLKQANSSRNVRDPPSRGELIRAVADVVDHTQQSEGEEVDEDAFGLGDWDSDEDKGK